MDHLAGRRSAGRGQTYAGAMLSKLFWKRASAGRPVAPAEGGPRLFCSGCREYVTLAGAVRTLLASGHWAWRGPCPHCLTVLHQIIQL